MSHGDFPMFLGFLLTFIYAIKFQLNVPSSGNEYKFCLSEYVADSTKVKGKFKIQNQPEQLIDLKVFDSPVQPFEDKEKKEVHDNVYYSKSQLSGDGTFTFTTHKFANILFCFTNVYNGNSAGKSLHTPVEFTIKTGMDIVDAGKEDTKEKLKPMEADLQKIANVAKEIVEQMEELKLKEMYLRDVNGSFYLYRRRPGSSYDLFIVQCWRIVSCWSLAGVLFATILHGKASDLINLVSYLGQKCFYFKVKLPKLMYFFIKTML